MAPRGANTDDDFREPIRPRLRATLQRVENGRPGKKYKLSDLRGKPVVLAFYPLDFSPTCTKENVCFRDDL